MKKLLYPFAGVMGLFFPIGKLEDGGTCQFATPKCYEECYACHMDTDMGIEFKVKRKVLNYFLDNDSQKIADTIHAQLREASCEIFTWFASGDCPGYLTEKFKTVVKLLDEAGIIQTGFTRNKSLWNACRNMSDNNKVLYSIEDISDATEEGLYSLPNYEIGAVDIVLLKDKIVRKREGCGGGYYENHIKVVEGKDDSHLKLDCNACYKNKTGCFTVW